MKEMLRTISTEKHALEETPFILWLGNKDITLKEKYSFVPSMAFFIMGFKDILMHLKSESSETDIEKLIAQHCEEDLGHWVWYVKDLERLGFEFSSWGEDLSSFFSRLWGNDTQECRRLVYLTMHYAQSINDPRLLLVIIEVMEATFGAFIDALHHSSRDKQINTELEFFGLKHHDAESNHSLGSWIDGKNSSADLHNVILSQEPREHKKNRRKTGSESN